jgi:hypothetical protein
LGQCAGMSPELTGAYNVLVAGCLSAVGSPTSPNVTISARPRPRGGAARAAAGSSS